MAGSPKHTDPAYKRARAVLIPAAYANPDHTCRRCGLTLEQRQAMFPDKQITWDLGHPAPFAAEHSDCNRSAGAVEGNRAREPVSRRWQ